MAHIQVHAVQGRGVDGDGLGARFQAGPHLLQNVQQGPVALQRGGVEALHPHGAAAQSARSQQVGRAGPIPFHAVVAGPVGAGADSDAQTARFGGFEAAPAAGGQGLPVHVRAGAGFYGKGEAKGFKGVQGEPHIRPGHGLLSAKGHGQGRGPQGGCQQQAGKELAGPLHAQFHFAAAKGRGCRPAALMRRGGQPGCPLQRTSAPRKRRAWSSSSMGRWCRRPAPWR